MLKVRIIYTDSNGLTKTLGDLPTANSAFLSKNPVLNFFKSVQLNINDVCITRNIQDISSVNTLWRSCFDSALQITSSESSNMILPQSITQTLTAYGGQNQYLFNKYSQQMEMICPIPLPAFQTNDPIPPHSKINLFLWLILRSVKILFNL